MVHNISNDLQLELNAKKGNQWNWKGSLRSRLIYSIAKRTNQYIMLDFFVQFCNFLSGNWGALRKSEGAKRLEGMDGGGDSGEGQEGQTRRKESRRKGKERKGGGEKEKRKRKRKKRFKGIVFVFYC